MCHVCFHLITIEDNSLHVWFQNIFNTQTHRINRIMKDAMSSPVTLKNLKIFLEDPPVFPTVVHNDVLDSLETRLFECCRLCWGLLVFSLYLWHMQLQSLSVSTGGEPTDISVCFGVFISGKNSMTYQGWSEPRTGWTNYSGLDNVSNTASRAKNSSLKEKTFTSIGCDKL